MSCPGANYIVPGADPCGGGGGGGVESINTLLGALTLTSSDNSITVTNAANNIDLSVAGASGTLVLHLSGVTDGTGVYTNNIGDTEGYFMLDDKYAVLLTQTALTDNPIILFVSSKNQNGFTVQSRQTNAVPEGGVPFDCIIVSTNFRKATQTPRTFPLPTFIDPNNFIRSGAETVPYGNRGIVPQIPNYTVPTDPNYIDPILNPTVTFTVTMCGKIDGSTPSQLCQFQVGIFKVSDNSYVAGWDSSPNYDIGTDVAGIVWGSPIPSSSPTFPNYVSQSFTVPYALLGANLLYYGIYIRTPSSPIASIFFGQPVNNLTLGWSVSVGFLQYT